MAIARAIATNPAMILADEPTGALDSTSTHEVLGLFEGLNAEGRTVIVITHEPDVAERAGRLIRLRDGLVVEDTGHASPDSVAAVAAVAATAHIAPAKTGMSAVGRPGSSRGDGL